MNVQNEVELLSKIQHPNVISLLGCSSNEDTRIIVYELMHNGSLETQLHGKTLFYMLYYLGYYKWLRCNEVSYKIIIIIIWRTFSWLSIDLAFEDENCSWHSKVTFPKQFFIYHPICLEAMLASLFSMHSFIIIEIYWKSQNN